MTQVNPAQPQPASPGRLDSWKEIASYLGRSVRTVRRWEESERLPVHRHHHEKSGSVYAFKEELDGWLLSRRAEPAGDAAAPRGKWRPARRAVLVAGAMVTAATVVVWVIVRPGYGGEPPAMSSLAVLPFANSSGELADAELADGLTAAVISELAGSGLARVIAKTSVMRYAKSAKTAPEVGRELNVEAVVKGTIARSGSRIRLSAELLDAQSDRQRWTDTFDRDLNDLVALQREVANAIVVAMLADGAHSANRVSVAPTPIKEEAYRLFFRAQLAVAAGQGPGTYRNAITLCRKAIEIQPNFARAYAQIAWYYNLMSVLGQFPPRDVMSDMETAARRAVELDDDLAAGHSMLGVVLYSFHWDWSGAEREFRRALSLDPNDAEGHRLFASLLWSQGRVTEALTEAERARELDPLSVRGLLSLGQAYRVTGQYDRAVTAFNAGLNMQGNGAGFRFQLALTHLVTGAVDQAVSELADAVTRAPDNRRYRAYQAYAYAVSGRRGEAQEILEELLSLEGHQYLPPTAVAHIFVGLGNQRAALAWLEKAYQEHDADLVGPFTAVALAELRSLPAYRTLFAKMGLAR